MADTILDTILDSLEEDMKKYIKISSDYRTTPTVVFRGAFGPNEVQSFPAIGFDITGEDLSIIYQNDEGLAYVELDLYGYAYSDGVDRISDVRNLAHDVLYFIYNDFTYTDNVEIVDKLEYYGHKTLVFRLPIRISYEYDYTTIK